MAYKPTYWNGRGAYQVEYERLNAELVPDEGKAQTLKGELLRTFSNMYYDWHNNAGCNVLEYEFLHAAKNAEFQFAEKIYDSRDLDKLADRVILFVMGVGQEGTQ